MYFQVTKVIGTHCSRPNISRRINHYLNCNILNMSTCSFNLLSIKVNSVLFKKQWLPWTYVHRKIPSIGCHIHYHIGPSACCMVHRFCNVPYSSHIVDLKYTIHRYTLTEIIIITHVRYVDRWWDVYQTCVGKDQNKHCVLIKCI